MGPVSDFMSKDHDRLDSIFSDFQKSNGKDLGRTISLFLNFMKGLQRHIEWEEKILFPVFEEKNKIKSNGLQSSGPTAVMRMEHAQIKEFLDIIQAMIENNNIDTADVESMLFDILKSHNEREEEILYPWIDSSLGESEALEILKKLK